MNMKDYFGPTTAVCLAGMKSAALNYDYLVPSRLTRSTEMSMLNDSKKIKRDNFHEIVEKDILHPKVYQIIEVLHDEVLRREFNSRKEDLRRGDFFGENEQLEVRQLRSDEYFVNILVEQGIPIDSVHWLSWEKPDNSSEQFNDDRNRYFVLSLANLELVDANKLSWDKILEMRKDKDTMKALRNLRLFIYSNYVDKPESYIYDRISQIIDEYKTTVRKWGIDTIESSFTMAMSEKKFLAIASFVWAIFGTLKLEEFRLGLTSTLDNMLIKIRERRWKLMKIQEQDPVHYL